jgi:hypothetical protein
MDKLLEMKELAVQKGGKCLSEKYLGYHRKLDWQCKHGHKWSTTPSSIKGTEKRKGTWCPECSGNQKMSIENMILLAEKNGGKCLSKNYVNARTRLIWECEEGHIWEATPDSVKHGAWCNICSSKKAGIKRRLGIEKMQEIAHEKGGKCLSTEYVNNMTKLQWECPNSHKWMATPEKIKAGKWCPYCAGNAKGTLEELQQIARLKGGKCLSSSYINIHTKLQWECGHGHTWQAQPNSIKRGTWCPYCNLLINESKTRFIFSYLLEQEFPKRRNIFEENYELDGYNEELKLAFEYNGIQHYEITKQFHKTEKDFLNQQKRDCERKELCINNGIDLIIVPYYINNSDQELIGFIVNELKTRKYKLIKENVNLEEFYKDLPELTELKQKAHELGGKLLSNFYINVETKLEWECKEGHKFKMSPSNVKHGHWCSICRGKKGLEKRKKTLLIDDKERFEKIKQFALSKGGECLSEIYKGVQYKLKFICAEGHIWETPAKLIIKGSWCDKCARKEAGRKFRVGIEYFKELAKEKGGECLTNTYEKLNKKLTFRCKEGHIFEAFGSNVKNKGTWCAKCAFKKRNTNMVSQQNN